MGQYRPEINFHQHCTNYDDTGRTFWIMIITNLLIELSKNTADSAKLKPYASFGMEHLRPKGDGPKTLLQLT